MAGLSAAREVPGNRGWSPIGTPQRHYRVDDLVTTRDGERHRHVVLVEGFGTTYVYAGDNNGEIVSWWTLAEVDGDDAAALAELGFGIAGSSLSSLHGPAA